MFGVDKLDELLAKLKPVLGEKRANMLWMLYHFDSHQRDLIESMAYLMSARYLDETFEKKDILLPPVPSDKASGEYPLGMVHYGNKPRYPFALKEEEWIHHVAIFGRSGSGKTNVAFLMLFNLLKQSKPFLVFDWKRNYRDLLAINNDFLVFPVGREPSFFCWNPLIPPNGISPTTWIKKLIEIICHAYFLGEGVAFLLMKALDAVYRAYNIYDGGVQYPTFKDVSNWIDKYKAKGREAQWLASTKRTLGVLCFGEFGKTLNVSKSIPIEQLLKKNAIIKLDALTKSDKTFFIETLLLWIHQHRLGENKRETFKHAIFIEEAHHILLKRKQEIEGEEAITDIILREIRELGESIILIDQHPSLISKPALGNTYTTIAMNLKHGSDVNSLSESMLLVPDQKQYLGELAIGSAIVKLQDRWFRPFLVKFPPFSLKKGLVTDRDVKNNMKGYLEKFGLQKDVSPFPENISDNRSIEKKTESRVSLLENGEKALLEDAAEYPMSGMVERYRRLGLNSYQGNKYKNLLIQKGLVKEVKVSTRKGRIKIIQPTSAANEYLDDPVIIPEPKHRNPGPDHEYWKMKIANYYQNKGCQVELEKQISDGGFVDIMVDDGEKSIAVEIETGKSNAIYNIQKNLKEGFDKIITVAIDKSEKNRITEELRNLNLDDNPRIKIMDAAKFT